MSQQALDLTFDVVDLDEGMLALVDGSSTADGFDDGRSDGLYVVPSGAYARLVKPALDRLIGLVAVLVALPVMAIVALAVRLALGPGIIFRQERVGQYGRPFTLYKFRSMHPDRRATAWPFDGPDRRRTHKSTADPRHTRVGRFLRKWSLDELPQLFNILRGEMSLIGPRPEVTPIVARYADWEHQRHAVRPGLTGLFQVTKRQQGMMHEHVDIDVDYVERLSARTDLAILLRTVPAVLGRVTGS